jgi:hypothetical protein
MSPPDVRSPRPDQEARPAEKSISGGVSSTGIISRPTDKRAVLGRLLDQIDLGEQLRVRAIRQAIIEAEASYWLQRSRYFAKVGTPDCDLIAENCRNHARLLAGWFDDVDEPWPGFNQDLELVLAEREAA